MSKVSKTDLQTGAVAALTLASALAKFTKTSRDDDAVSLLLSIVLDPEKFEQLCKIAGIVESPTV
jgi:hypothetical protein